MICSADGHVVEPDDLYTSMLPRRFRARAPRYEYDSGLIRWTDRLGVVKQWSTPLWDVFGERVLADSGQRIRSLDDQGIRTEVLYPNHLEMLREESPEYALAMAQVYNDYLFDSYGGTDRFVPVATVPVVDIADAVAEVERVAALGARSITITERAPVPYYDAVYEPFWSVVEEAGLVLSFHIGTTVTDGKTRSEGVGGGRRIPDADELQTTLQARRSSGTATISHPAQEVIAHLVGAGVLERHPDLHVVAVEYHAHWLASLMFSLEKAWTLAPGQPDVHIMGDFDPDRLLDDQPRMVNIFGFNDKWPYPLRPSEYVRRQVHCTFMDDPGALALREFTGVDCLLWAADFPHPEGTAPETAAALDRQFVGVSARDREKITGGTLRSIYKMGEEVAQVT